MHSYTNTSDKHYEVRWEVIAQDDASGDIIIPLPIPLLQKLGWKEGDVVEIDVNTDGQLYLKKANT